MRRRLPAPLLLILFVCAPQSAHAFGFGDVALRAQQLAAEPYRKPETVLPRELLELSYDQYRDIRFKTDNSLWRSSKLPFEVQFFHPGLYYRWPVKINVVTEQGPRPLAFNPDNFNYGHNTLDKDKLRDIGYAGFRLHYPINTKKYKDEVAVFLGASYFRALGKNQRYGLSSRGLAVDTAEPTGEEFPSFTEYWLVRPAAGAKELEIYALLDSRRVTGAYRFVIRPGAETQMDVQMRLYLREPVAKIGIAPLTSMFYFGENQRANDEDYRPEVHDSDGLMIHNGNGEWLWRPLVDPRRLLVTSFSLHNPQGFGLVQRDRNFEHYQDLEARYDVRPSAWITPRGNWGSGRVELVQIPTPDETNDNVVAYWVPDSVPPPGQPLDLQYRLAWQMQQQTLSPASWVVQTRRGHGYRKVPDDSLRLIVEFEGPALKKLPANAKVAADVWVGEPGEVLEHQVFRNEVTGGWRVSIRLHRKEEDKPVELRASLKNGKDVISETWSYVLPP